MFEFSGLNWWRMVPIYMWKMKIESKKNGVLVINKSALLSNEFSLFVREIKH